MMKRKVRRIYEEPPPDNNGDKDLISFVVRLFTLSTKRAYDQSQFSSSVTQFSSSVTRIYTSFSFVIYVLYGKEVMRRREDRGRKRRNQIETHREELKRETERVCLLNKRRRKGRNK